ncbi:MAG: TFIIB-type zinc finger domain-containing protein [Candidatus Aphodosoma sp.]
MKPLKCEMCGSTDVIKQDGLFICQYCGTKYSVEEAKKMMPDTPVTIQGSVQIDNTNTLQNLYATARKAKEMNNINLAIKSYEQILTLDSQNWEPVFYSTYFSIYNNINSTFVNTAFIIKRCTTTVCNLVYKGVEQNEQPNVISEIFSRLYELSIILKESTISHYSSIHKSEQYQYKPKLKKNIAAIASIMLNLGDVIQAKWKGCNEDIKYIGAESWVKGIEIFSSLESEFISWREYKNVVDNYKIKIKTIKADYKTTMDDDQLSLVEEIDTTNKNNNTGGACYIATCVYGSYNCPEVWTLRRFRDNTLYKTWYGRTFIKINT